MSEVEKNPLMGVLRDIRDTAIDVFSDKVREFNKDKTMDAHDVLTSVAAAAVDHAIAGTVDSVFNYPSLYIEEQTVKYTPGSDTCKITTQFIPGLAEMYLSEVST
jgi:hypothetical protein